MSDEAKTKLEESVSALRAMLRGETITEAVYYKQIVMLAYEYLLLNDTQNALLLLNSIPVSYYENTQGEHMAADPKYLEQATFVAATLISSGLVDENMQLEPISEPVDLPFTQKPGLA